jgi:hypothetical protein
MNKTAIVLLNYNMPERADDAVANILARVQAPYELIVVDNGSDIMEPADSTTLWLGKNVQVSNGFRMGLAYADAIAAWERLEFFAYWFLITSLQFLPNEDYDPLARLLKPMIDDPEVAFVVPTLTPETNTAWEHMKKREGLTGTRETWGTDFYLAGLVRAEWFNEIGRFNPALRYGWGVCSEVNWYTRKAEKKILLHEDVMIRKDTDVAYEMGRMGMSAADRRTLSSDEMNFVLNEKWGVGALKRLGHEHRKESYP